jgi:hypothetical protein
VRWKTPYIACPVELKVKIQHGSSVKLATSHHLGITFESEIIGERALPSLWKRATTHHAASWRF